MSDYDENDPKLEGYTPIEDYMKKDMDRSSRRIRDMPYGKRKEAGALSSDEMDFGTININDVSPAQIAILYNTGYDDLLIKNMIVVGDFLITTNCGDHLKPGETCQINVQFNPKHEGNLTGGVYVDTEDAAGNKFIKFLGNGELNETN